MQTNKVERDEFAVREVHHTQPSFVEKFYRSPPAPRQNRSGVSKWLFSCEPSQHGMFCAFHSL